MKWQKSVHGLFETLSMSERIHPHEGIVLRCSGQPTGTVGKASICLIGGCPWTLGQRTCSPDLEHRGPSETTGTPRPNFTGSLPASTVRRNGLLHAS